MPFYDFPPPPSVPDNAAADNSQLSLFQQTLKEKDEEFYKTFPAARVALEQQFTAYTWRPVQRTSDCVPSHGFQLDSVPYQDVLNYTYNPTPTPTQPLPHISSQSPPPLSFNPPHPVEVQYPYARSQDYTGYATPQLASTDAQGEQLINVPAPSTLNIRTPAFDIPYPIQPHQYPHPHHQRVPSPVMDSLPSPDSVSDSPQAPLHSSPHFHTPPHQAYYTSLPLTASVLPSPTHQEISAPLSPPALVQATYPNRFEAEQQQQPPVFAEPLPSPPRDPSVPPSRRNSHHILHRSQRRYSPTSSRPSHSTHKSGGSGTTILGPISTRGWTLPSSGPTTPSGVGVSANVSTLVDAVNTAAAQAVGVASTTTSTATATASPPLPGPSSNAPTTLKPRPPTSSLNRSSSTARNGSGTSTMGMMGNKRGGSDKKPALACVFCRGRKIACGPPIKDGDGKTCNQCHRRSLQCEYPTESRRGMRKKSTSSTTAAKASSSTGGASVGEGSTSTATGNPQPNTSPESPKTSSSPSSSSNKKR